MIINRQIFNQTSTLFLALVIGLFCFNANAQRYAGDRSSYDNQTPAIYDTDEVYIEECGTCHLSYAPSLLPIQSWNKILKGLEDHFDENAEVDQETMTHLANYLKENALGKGKIPLLETLIKDIPKNAPVRITELPQFIKEHESTVKQLGGVILPVGFFSPCEDCHKEAASGIFSKEKIYKGYGPSFKIGEDPKLK